MNHKYPITWRFLPTTLTRNGRNIWQLTRASERSLHFRTKRRSRPPKNVTMVGPSPTILSEILITIFAVNTGTQNGPCIYARSVDLAEKESLRCSISTFLSGIICTIWLFLWVCERLLHSQTERRSLTGKDKFLRSFGLSYQYVRSCKDHFGYP